MANEMHELIEELNTAANAYYSDSPIMSDKEYDVKYARLKELEEQAGVALSHSPTQRVMGVVLPELPKMTLPYQYLSADNIGMHEAIEKLRQDKALAATYKLDGLSVILHYYFGVLQYAITRGNGVQTNIVTEQIRHIKGVPMKIPYIKGHFEVRGEGVQSRAAYKEYTETHEPSGDDHGHPRNIASGGIQQLDTSTIAEKNIDFVAFSMVEEGTDRNEGFEPLDIAFGDKLAQLDFLQQLGFTTVAQLGYATVGSKDDIPAVFDKMKPENCPYPTDGLIFELLDLGFGRTLGQTGHHKNSMKAWKWPEELHKTIFRGIDFRVTRYGPISMTAFFDPVRIDHATVQRAVIPNLNYFDKFQLGVGDEIEVFKAKGTIPNIYGNNTHSGTYQLPTECPCCGTALEIKESRIRITGEKPTRFLFCPNKQCQDQLIQMLVHYCGAEQMNISGVSDSTIKMLVENGFVKTWADFYRIDRYKRDISFLPGYGAKSYDKMWNAIQASKRVPLEQFIPALGIPNIGNHAGRIIQEKFDGNFEAFVDAIKSGFDFTSLPDFGEVMANSLRIWWKDPQNVDMLMDLVSEIEFTQPTKNISTENMNMKSEFVGKHIVVTGKVSINLSGLAKEYTRSDMNAYIQGIGAVPDDRVTARTDYVVAGDRPGSKLAKAQERNITILTPEQFFTIAEES